MTFDFGDRYSNCFARVIMSTRLYRDLFQYITKYVFQPYNSSYSLSIVLLSDHDVYGRRRAKVWPHPNVEVAVHKTIEVDVDLRADEEYGGNLKQTISMRSQEEIQMMAEELQMKKDLQI